jgi:hypothetical protein
MMRSVLLRFVLPLLICCTTPQFAAAQQWHAEVQAGRIRSALDAAGTAAQTLAVGLSYRAVNSGLGLSVGVPASQGEPLWGSINGSHRAAVYRGRFVFGVDLSASGYVMHDRAERIRNVPDVFGRPQVVTEPPITGNAFAAQAAPVIGIEATRWQLHARTGASLYRSRFGELERSRTVIVSDVQLTVTPTSTFALAPVVRRFAADDAQHLYAGMTAIAGNDAGSLWASAGTWPNVDSAGVSWGLGATLKVLSRASLTASGRHDGFDALYLNPAQTSWSLGLSVRIGGSAPAAMPVPAAYENGRATIQLDAAHASTQPMIAGDFTNWKPRPMQRTRDAWTYTAHLAPGVYNYAFVDAQGKWFVPEDYPGRKSDGMGGTVAVLVVR